MLSYRIAPAALIMTDILIPEQEGLETIQELQHVSSEVKIIAISGGSRERGMDFLSVAKLLGAQCTLRKPVRREELLAAVRTLVHEWYNTASQMIE